MRIITLIMLSAFLLIGQGGAEEQPKAKNTTMSEKEKLGYSLGYKTGKDMRTGPVDIDLETYVKGLRDGHRGEEASMTDQEMRKTLSALQKELKAKQGEKMKGLSEKNKKEGGAFLGENAKKEGVVTLSGGLQYKVMKEGTGKSPSKTDKVKVHYRGTFINGTEFHNTFKSGKPVIHDVSKFIKGMSEALQLMKEGSKWMLFVPSNLAYSEKGFRGVVGPNQTLIFEVELISVESQAPKNGG